MVQRLLQRLRAFRRLPDSLASALSCRAPFSIALFFLLAVIFTAPLETDLRLGIGLSLVLGAGLFYLFSRKRDLDVARDLSLFVLIAAAVFLSSEGVFFHTSTRPLARAGEWASTGEVVLVEGEVREKSASDTVFWVETVEGEALGLSVRAPFSSCSVGDVFSFSARFVKNAGSSAESVGAYRCEFSLEPVGETTYLPDCVSWQTRLARLCSERLSQAKSAPLLRAILLADQSEVPSSLAEDLRLTGSSHLLALSGLHLGILCAFFYAFLRLLFCGRRLAVGLTAALGFCFLCVCGVPLSLLRAFSMMLIAFAVELLRLKRNPVQNLLLATAVIVFFDRAALFDVGFLLSVFATFGILLFLPLAGKSFWENRFVVSLSEGFWRLLLRRVLWFFFSTFCASFAALVFTLPLVAFTFGEVCLLSPLFGLLLIPLFTLFLYAAFLYLVVLLLNVPVLAAFFGAVTDALAMAFAYLAEELSALEFAMLRPPVAALVFATAVLALAVLVCLRYRIRPLASALVLPLFLFALFLGNLLFPTAALVPSAVLLHDGDECALFVTTEKTCLLVEEGSPSQASFDRLAQQGAETLDEVVLLRVDSHTADRLLRLWETVPFQRLWVPEEARTALLEELRFALPEASFSLCGYSARTPICLGEVTVTPFFGEGAVGAELGVYGSRLYFAAANVPHKLTFPEADAVFYVGDGTAEVSEETLLINAGDTDVCVSIPVGGEPKLVGT